jgi:hypothetical protein
VYRIGTITVCLAVPLTAVGIATDRRLEAPAAIVLACGMLLSSFVVGVSGARRAFSISKPAAVFFAISGITLLFTMSLAAAFAATGSAGRVLPSVPIVHRPHDRASRCAKRGPLRAHGPLRARASVHPEPGLT